MLGYDSTSPQDHPKEDGTTPNDDEIIEICLSSFRILISKDFEIVKKMREKTDKNLKNQKNFTEKFDITPSLDKKYPCVLLRSTEITENLSVINSYFDIQLEYNIELARCPKCNSNLQKIQNAEDFKDRIPPSVFAYHTLFWKCSNSKCGQVYWRGTHLDRIKKTLKSVQKKDYVKDIKEISRNIP